MDLFDHRGVGNCGENHKPPFTLRPNLWEYIVLPEDI